MVSCRRHADRQHQRWRRIMEQARGQELLDSDFFAMRRQERSAPTIELSVGTLFGVRENYGRVFGAVLFAFHIQLSDSSAA